MDSMYFPKIRELKKEKALLEQKLGIKINIEGKKVTFEGEAFKEYEAAIVLEAIQFGFSVKKALSLTDERLAFRKIPMKKFTRRKNMQEVRSRVIGKEGKTKRTIEDISNSDVIINENTIGIICPADEIEESTTAITNLIKGSKQANVYRFLERMNAAKKKLDNYTG